jgi:hypothetical protein
MVHLISGCPPAIGSWRKWKFMMMTGAEKVPVELKYLLSLTLKSISNEIKDVQDRPRDNPKKIEEKNDQVKLMFSNLNLAETAYEIQR